MRPVFSAEAKLVDSPAMSPSHSRAAIHAFNRCFWREVKRDCQKMEVWQGGNHEGRRRKTARSSTPVLGDSSGVPAYSTRLLQRIIGRLARDHHIVHMTFAEAGHADPNEARLLQQLRNGSAAAVSHARLQTARHLLHDHGDRSAIG